MEVSLLRCQLDETFCVGEVTTCAHSEAGQLLLDLVYGRNLALRKLANAFAEEHWTKSLIS